jgi:[protein-PII] uridylyltransferase
VSALPNPAGSVAALRTRVRDGKAALIDAFRAARPSTAAARRLGRSRARHVDGVLTTMWHAAELPPGATLVAVGGYGRGELYPH